MHPFKDDRNYFSVIVLHIYLEVCVNKLHVEPENSSIGTYKVEISDNCIALE